MPTGKTLAIPSHAGRLRVGHIEFDIGAWLSEEDQGIVIW